LKGAERLKKKKKKIAQRSLLGQFFITFVAIFTILVDFVLEKIFSRKGRGETKGSPPPFNYDLRPLFSMLPERATFYTLTVGLSHPVRDSNPLVTDSTPPLLLLLNRLPLMVSFPPFRANPARSWRCPPQRPASTATPKCTWSPSTFSPRKSTRTSAHQPTTWKCPTSPGGTFR
jgi:hypothetical protein